MTKMSSLQIMPSLGHSHVCYRSMVVIVGKKAKSFRQEGSSSGFDETSFFIGQQGLSLSIDWVKPWKSFRKSIFFQINKTTFKCRTD